LTTDRYRLLHSISGDDTVVYDTVTGRTHAPTDLDAVWTDVDAALAQLALAVTRLDPEGDSVLFRALALSRIHLERAVRTLGEAGA